MSECGVALTVPAGWTLRRESEAPPPLCVLQGQGGPATPFVNSVTVLPWSQLSKLEVHGVPLRTIGFFQLANGAVEYQGRRDYEDGRHGFAQKAVGKTVPSRSTSADGSHRLIVRNQLRVKWIKPAVAGVEDDARQTLACVDAALWNTIRVAIFNWCAPAGDAAVGSIEAMARSMSLPGP